MGVLATCLVMSCSSVRIVDAGGRMLAADADEADDAMEKKYYFGRALDHTKVFDDRKSALAWFADPYKCPTKCAARRPRAAALRPGGALSSGAAPPQGPVGAAVPGDDEPRRRRRRRRVRRAAGRLMGGDRRLEPHAHQETG
jgi:hypothetical protein